MTDVAIRPEALRDAIAAALGEKASAVTLALGEVTAVVPVANYLAAMQVLRDAPTCRFEQLLDLCAVDYSAWRDTGADGPRFAVVSHLLSVSLNQRVRVRVYCPDDDFPVVPSVTALWSGANWFEREAFDLFGVVFDGHEDLRRILTDYGFIGHPFRKDFPISGEVEMRYDEQQRRVVYEPVTIEPREITPRIIREEHYAGLDRGDQWLGGANQ
ncbi:MAG: NADH-quinone oxidoreductase subunit C [Comamonadaceae bacterium]|nr:NADH-quinone oxidoreductase subunit C [Burkholderiales bacterium]MEB2348742.1 NADH-quinone oxidoreductase subunit C [Comamonadaceae bacterium]